MQFALTPAPVSGLAFVLQTAFRDCSLVISHIPTDTVARLRATVILPIATGI